AGRYLQKKGTDFLILEKNKHIGDKWRKRYESLTLFSPANLSALPELPMALAPKSRPNKTPIADYFNRYVEHFDLPVHVTEEVREISKGDGLFHIKASMREYTAEKIIHAAGFCEKPCLPDWFADLDILYIHSSEYRSPISVKGNK